MFKGLDGFIDMKYQACFFTVQFGSLSSC